jgi:hypothetical protein
MKMSKSRVFTFFLMFLGLLITFFVGQSVFSSAPPPTVTGNIANTMKNTTPPMSASDFKNNVTQLNQQTQNDLNQQVKTNLKNPSSSSQPSGSSSTGSSSTGSSSTSSTSGSSSNNSGQAPQTYTGFGNSGASSAAPAAAPASNGSSTNSNSSSTQNSQSNSGGGWNIKY